MYEFKCEYRPGCEYLSTRFLHMVIYHALWKRDLNNRTTIQALCEFHYKEYYEIYSDSIKRFNNGDVREVSIDEYKVMTVMCT